MDRSKSKWCVCRICLRTDDDMQHIYADGGSVSDLVEKIELCGNIKLDSLADLPDLICSNCLLLVQVAYKFRLLCQETEKKLQNLQDNYSDASASGNLTKASDSDIETVDDQESVDVNTTEPSIEGHTLQNEMKEEHFVDQTCGQSISSNDLNGMDIIIEDYEEVKNDGADETETFQIDFLQNEFNENLIDELHYSPKPNSPSEIAECNDRISNEILEEEIIELEDSEQGNESVATTTVRDRSTEGHKKVLILKTLPVKRKRRLKQKTADATEYKVTTLENQLVAVEEIQPLFMCTHCGNSYSDKSKLTSHMKIHTKQRPHECEICHKRFGQSPQLARHMNSHTGNRPYKCDFCSAKFADPSTRIKHQRIHTNERPYACEICGKSFAYSNVLKTHMTMHTGEKPHRCSICNKQFSQLHHMKAHRDLHLVRLDSKNKE